MKISQCLRIKLQLKKAVARATTFKRVQVLVDRLNIINAKIYTLNLHAGNQCAVLPRVITARATIRDFKLNII